ncbi:MAG: Lrp/AsnC ligand binding domain-containing protein [Candidatus Bathyarchaeia archaeon]
MKAYIFVQTKPATSIEVVSRIKSRVKEVVVADAIYGRYDAIITVEVSDLAELSRHIYKVIEKIPNVVKTETSIVLFSINEILYKVIEQDPNIIHTETALVLSQQDSPK